METMLILMAYLISTAVVVWAVRAYYSWRERELMKHRKLTTSGFIYFVQQVSGSRTLVKIGRSVDPIKRIRQLRTSAPFGLRVLGVMPAMDDVASEKIIHQKFKALRVSSRNEWFRMSVPLLLYINLVSDPVVTAVVRKAVK